MIKLFFEKLSSLDRVKEPCTVAIPFAQGELFDLSSLSITDGTIPTLSQFKITAKWPDSSAKWVLANFLADLPGNKSKSYYCITKDENHTNTKTQESAVCDVQAIIIEKQKDNISINTGELQVELGKAGELNLFNYIKNKYITYSNKDITGPTITDSLGECFDVKIGEDGFEILEEGPVRAILQTKGKHFNHKKQAFIDYTIRIIAFAGKPWIKMEYQITNCEKGEAQFLQGIEMKFTKTNVEVEKINTAVAHSNYKSEITQGKMNEKVYHLIDANQLVNEANEHIPEVFYGTFWADWQDEKTGGICTTIHQAQQNFPKALEASKDGITLKILPSETGGLNILQGIAKTHRLLLHFHGPEETLQSLNIRSLQFQFPDRPILETSVYEKASVYEQIFVDKEIAEVELALIMKADSRGKAYGMLNWGDAPDGGYTQQGRGHGKQVWTNNEYDFPHAAMLMYARTSERRMLDYMLVTAEHWMDVDVCHFNDDPLRFQAQITHSADHVSGDVEASHEWVEGLFDYYHQTGEKFSYDTAIGIGENILRQLSRPRYQKKGGINARETGWALRALVALYIETNDEKWLEPAETIVDHFKAWKEEYGAWLAPYTDHTAIRVPFMIAIAVGSLMRYYRIRPQKEIKDLILDAVKDLIENCRLENGLFFYKELPSLRRLGNNTLVLEALAIAYELTNDPSYLLAGKETFDKALSGEGSGGGSKRIEGDAVLIQGQGPKGFAQCFYPIVSYYAAMVKEGLIP